MINASLPRIKLLCNYFVKSTVKFRMKERLVKQNLFHIYCSVIISFQYLILYILTSRNNSLRGHCPTTDNFVVSYEKLQTSYKSMYFLQIYRESQASIALSLYKLKVKECEWEARKKKKGSWGNFVVGGMALHSYINCS